MTNRGAYCYPNFAVVVYYVVGFVSSHFLADAESPYAIPRAYCVAWVHVDGNETAEWAMLERHSAADSENLTPNLEALAVESLD